MLNWGDFGAAGHEYGRRNSGPPVCRGDHNRQLRAPVQSNLRAVGDLVAVGRSAEEAWGISSSGLRSQEHRAAQMPMASNTRSECGWPRWTTATERWAGSTRSSRSCRAQPLKAQDEYLVGRASRSVCRLGRWSYRAALQQGDSAGVVLPRDSVRVSATDGTSLALSDIALGTPGRAVPWITEARTTVLLAPTALFRKGDAIEIYYEASGARAGQPYRHEITVFSAET